MNLWTKWCMDYGQMDLRQIDKLIIDKVSKNDGKYI
jgi:hypothetical protein